MRKSLIIILLIVCGCACTSRKPFELVVLETTDFHGVFDGPMARAANYILQMKREVGNKLLLLDCGDLLQGSSEVYFSNFVDTHYRHIYVDLMHYLPYSALAVGNHDLEYGDIVFSRVYNQCDQPVLCANVINKATGEPLFQPYAVFKKGGYIIAVLGMTNSEAVSWLGEFRGGTLSFQSIQEAAGKWRDIIYERENPDVLIGLFHTGITNTDRLDDEYDDNAASWVAENVPGFHLICCGHVHKPMVRKIVSVSGDTVALMQGGANASFLAQARLQLTPSISGKTQVKARMDLINSDSFEEDAQFEAYITPFLKRAHTYENQIVCDWAVPTYSRDAFDGPSGWVDLLHRVLFQAATTGSAKYIGGEVSFASPASRNLIMDEGPATVKDFIAYYPYENGISIMEMWGYEIVDYLEYAYALRLDAPDSPAYSFDSAAGILYTVDARAPRGKRVHVIEMADGAPFDSNRRYHVIMNSFRARGGGGHLVQGLGWSKELIYARTLWNSDRDLRSYLMEYCALLSPVFAEPMNHWRYL